MGGTRARDDASSARLAADRAWEGPVGPRRQAGLFGRVLASRPALPEPVVLAVHFQDVDMMGDAVEQRAGEALAGEHRRPFLEWQVGGDDSGAVLVVPAEDVEQQLASGLRQGHVAEFVDDQEIDPHFSPGFGGIPNLFYNQCVGVDLDRL